MAELDYGNPIAAIDDALVENETENTASVSQPSISMDGMTPIGQTMEETYSSEELNDPNKISVAIADYKTPLVVLFGPPACGKTMTLIRLTRYLQSRGYIIQPVTSFRPTFDRNYSNMCDNFTSMINSDEAAKSTSKINFMLIQVIHNGRTICQILEGPGEHYFHPQEPKKPFPRYVNAIINSQNRKIWAIMIEPDNTNRKMDSTARRNYVSKIHLLKTKIRPQDKVMFIFNKIDETHYVQNPGNIKTGLAIQQTEFLYPNVFVPFKNQNPITKLWKENSFDFCPFQTGDFSKAADGTLTFEQGNDIYPQKLWKVILKRIRG